MIARPSTNMSRLRQAQLKHACHHLFRCQNFALAWAMLAWWMIATRQILVLACQCKLSPKGVALTLLLALTVTLSFPAIKKRGGQEGEISIWYCKCFFTSENFLPEYRIGFKVFTACITVFHFADSTSRSDMSPAKLVRTAGWGSRGVSQRQIRLKPWLCSIFRILDRRKNTN